MADIRRLNESNGIGNTNGLNKYTESTNANAFKKIFEKSLGNKIPDNHYKYTESTNTFDTIEEIISETEKQLPHINKYIEHHTAHPPPSKL